MVNHQERYSLAETGLMRLENLYRTRTGREFVRQTLAPIPFVKGWCTLDLGCGTGHFTRQIASLVGPGEVIGVDNDPKALALARALTEQEGPSNIRWMQASALELPLADSTFDLVFMHLFLEHFRDPQPVLDECRRVLKPGGRLVAADIDGFLSTWHPPDPVMDELQGFFHFVGDAAGINSHLGRELFALFRAGGLQDIEVHVVSDVYAGVPEPARVDNVRLLMQNLSELLKAYVGADRTDDFVRRVVAYLEREDTLIYHNLFVVQGRQPAG